jgi:hypothetical protein
VALGSTQPLTETSKGGRCVGLTTLLPLYVVCVEILSALALNCYSPKVCAGIYVHLVIYSKDSDFAPGHSSALNTRQNCGRRGRKHPHILAKLQSDKPRSYSYFDQMPHFWLLMTYSTFGDVVSCSWQNSYKFDIVDQGCTGRQVVFMRPAATFVSYAYAIKITHYLGRLGVPFIAVFRARLAYRLT